MKNFYTFLIAILVSGLGFGQATQIVSGTQPAGGATSSVLDTPAEFFQVFEFTLNDVAGDGNPTRLANVNLQSSSTASLNTFIEAVRLVSSGTPLDSNVPQITPTDIDISFSGSDIVVIPEGGSQTFSVEIYFKGSGNLTGTGPLVDNSTFSFFIASNASGGSGFSIEGTSSSIADPATDITGNTFSVDVDVTELRFLQQPTDVAAFVTMTPQVRVGLTDINGNVDTNAPSNTTIGPFFANNIRISAPGLSPGSIIISPAFSGSGFTGFDGIAFFNLLVFNTTGTNITLLAQCLNSSLGLSSRESDEFDVTAASAGTTYTYDGTSWTPGDPNNVSTSIDTIIIEAGDIVISSGTRAANVIVNPGAGLTVNSTLTVFGTLTLESTSTSYASFIFDGNETANGTVVAGNIIYNRFVNANSNGNDLISAPLVVSPADGIGWQDFLNMGNNDTDLLSAPGSPTVYAFAPFVKGSTDDYVNYTSATDNGTTRLNSGVGFRAATVADEDSDPLNGIGRTLTFSGDVRRTTVAVGVSFDPGAFADWNLIGNPYPSYISSQAFFTSTVASATPNIDKITNLSGIYGYDGDVSDGWDVITLVDPDRLIAPGQGFFIPATNGGASGTVSNSVFFDNSMRTTGNSDDFIAGRNASALIFLKLKASTTNKTYKTQFYFNENASLGGDHGYDGRILGTPPNFALYSHLVQDNTGLPMALQALNPSDLVDTTVIPLGVNSNQGEQITFSILESSLPDTIEVYLEDTVTNTFTLLNSGDYTLTPNVALNGTGRFYLRFGEGALSTTETTLADLNIFTNQNDKTIVIAGQLLEPTTASVYDIQGRLVNTTPLVMTSRTQSIDVSNLSSGVYVVQLTNGTQNKTQKVILR